MKPFNYCLALFFVILPFSLFSLAPYPVVKEKLNTTKVKVFIDIPISKIEQKLDKELKWHEKIAINSFKRKLKRQAKKNPKILEKQLTNTEIENNKMDAGIWVLIILFGLPLLIIGIIYLIIIISCSTGDGCH